MFDELYLVLVCWCWVMPYFWFVIYPLLGLILKFFLSNVLFSRPLHYVCCILTPCKCCSPQIHTQGLKPFILKTKYHSLVP